MPRIKLFQKQEGLRGAGARGTAQIRTQFQADDFGSQAVGEAIGKGIDLYSKVAAQQKIAQDAKDVSWKNLSIATHQREMLEAVEKLETAAPLGADGHIEDVRRTYEEKTKTILDSAPESVRDNMKSQLMGMNNTYLARSMTYQSKSSGLKIAQDFKSTTTDYANTAASHPETWEAQRVLAKNAVLDIKNKRYSEVDKANLLKDSLEEIDFAGAKGTITKAQTPEALDEILKQMADGGSVYNDRLNPKDFQTLEKYAVSRKADLNRDQETTASNELKSIASQQAVDVAVITGKLLSGDPSVKPADLEALRDKIANDTRLYAGKAGSINSLNAALRTATRKSLNLSGHDKKLKSNKHSLDIGDLTRQAFQGNLEREDIDLFRDVGFIENEAEYSKVLNALENREAMAAAQEAGDTKAMAKLDKWWTQSKKDHQDQEKDFAVTDYIRSVAHGQVPFEELEEKQQWLGKRYKEATKAFDSWDKQDSRVKLKHQERIRTIGYVDFAREVRNVSTEQQRSNLQSEADRRRALPDGNPAQLTPAEWSTITTKLDSVLNAGRQEALLFQEFAAVAADPQNVLRDLNAKDSASFDVYYRQVSAGIISAAQEEAAENPEDRDAIMSGALDDMVGIIVNTGKVPASVEQDITGGLRSQDPTTVLQSADMMARIQSARPQDSGMFSEQQYAVGRMMLDMVNDGVDPKEAHKLVMQTTSAEGKSKSQDRRASYQAISGKKDGKETVGSKALIKLIQKDDAWDVKEFFGSNASNIPPEFKGSFDRTAQTYYELTGDIEVSRDLAFKQMKGTWGVSYMSGKPNFVRRPPELMYAAPGMNAEENSKWMKEQAVLDMSDNSMVAEGLADRIIFTPHPTQTVNGKPTYTVIIKGNDGRLHIQKKAFYPNYETSPARKRYLIETARREDESEEQDRKNLDTLNAVREASGN